MKNKFNFYEKVIVISLKKEYLKISGLVCVISGMAQNDDGSWGYAVSVNGIVWNIDEGDLESTGEFAPKNFNRTGETIRVIVDENGRGKIKN